MRAALWATYEQSAERPDYLLTLAFDNLSVLLSVCARGAACGGPRPSSFWL